MRRLWWWLSGIWLGLLCAMAASAECPAAWDPAQTYDASAGSLTACILDTDGATAVCTWTFTGQNGHVAEVALAGPKLGAPLTVPVPAGSSGRGS